MHQTNNFQWGKQNKTKVLTENFHQLLGKLSCYNSHLLSTASSAAYLRVSLLCAVWSTEHDGWALTGKGTAQGSFSLGEGLTWP